MRWPAFRTVFAAVHGAGRGLAASRHDRRDTLRLLDSLGHCELEGPPEPPRVWAAPSVLASLPGSGPPQAVLCGARAPAASSRLLAAASRFGRKAAVMTEEQPTGLALVPDRISIEAEDESIIEGVAADLGIEYVRPQPAWSILNFCAPLDTYISNLVWQRSTELNWCRSDFDGHAAEFRLPERHDRSSRLRLSRYRNPIDGMSLYLIWHGSVCAKVDPDWARYAVMRDRSVPCLFYDRRRQAVACRSGAPLPRLLARSLTLCSGYVPAVLHEQHLRSRAVSPGLLLVYSGVPQPYAVAIANKLGTYLVDSAMYLDTEYPHS